MSIMPSHAEARLSEGLVPTQQEEPVVHVADVGALLSAIICFPPRLTETVRAAAARRELTEGSYLDNMATALVTAASQSPVKGLAERLPSDDPARAGGRVHALGVELAAGGLYAAARHHSHSAVRPHRDGAQPSALPARAYGLKADALMAGAYLDGHFDPAELDSYTQSLREQQGDPTVLPGRQADKTLDQFVQKVVLLAPLGDHDASSARAFDPEVRLRSGVVAGLVGVQTAVYWASATYL